MTVPCRRRGRLAQAAFATAAVLTVGLGLSAPSSAAESASFEQWLEELRAEAMDKGIRAQTLDAALDGVAPIPRVIELDRKQPEFTMTMQEYLGRVVTKTKIANGRKRLQDNRALLEEVGRAYGVQPRFIVSLWGIETDYGRITGGFPVVASLATLAHDGRRSAFFRKELLNALTILDEGHIAPAEMSGSWAGAMGQCQFMPSSFLAYARDEDGDGHKDIWTTRKDVFASAANYLASQGWKDDQTWGRAVKVPAGFDAKGLGDGKVIKGIREWQALGVRRPDGSDLPTRNLPAAIIVPEGGGPAYMVYDNFRTLMHWNRSNYFGVAVGTLADAIAGR